MRQTSTKAEQCQDPLALDAVDRELLATLREHPRVRELVLEVRFSDGTVRSEALIFSFPKAGQGDYSDQFRGHGWTLGGAIRKAAAGFPAHLAGRTNICKCGASYAADAAFCSNCGQPVERPEAEAA